MNHKRVITQLRACFFTAALMGGIASAYEIPSYVDIAANRDALVKWLATNQSGVEFYTESVPIEGGAETEIALIVDGIEIDEASETLTGPGAWCEVLFLHLNVKSCVYGMSEDGRWLRMYMGRKFYQDPKKAKQIELQFDSGITDDNVSWVTLTADEGPFNTSDYYVGLFAIDAENGTYAQIRSSQKTGGAATAAVNLYFNTLARNKVGFSVVGTDSKGNPKYSVGSQAALERNVVRYLLALRIFMQTHTVDGAEGMRTRTELWYDATDRYAEQLYEVDRDDYLRDKEKEYRHQVELQAAVND